MEALERRQSRSITNMLYGSPIIEGVVITAFVTFYYLHTLTFFAENDFLFSASAHATGDLYKDVHYNQAPFGFYFWRFIALLSPLGTSYIVMRAVSATLGLAGIILAAYRLLPIQSVRLIFFLLAASSSPLLDIGGEIATYTLAAFFVIVGYVLLFSKIPAPIRYALGGLAIGLATSSKLNHAFMFLPPLFLMYMERSELDTKRVFSAFCLGGLVGLSPCLVEFIKSPKAFWLHNIIFHSQFTINAVNHGIFGAIQTIPPILRSFGYEHGAALVLAIYVIVKHVGWRDRCSVFLLSAVFAAVSMALLQIRSFEQYFGPAALLTILLYCRVFISAPKIDRALYLLPALAMGLIGAVDHTRLLAYTIVYSEAGVQPSISQVVKINDALRSFRDGHKLCDDRIFSLEGILVDESGFTLSPNMELGPFWERLSGYIPERYFDDPEYQLDRALVSPADWVVASGVRFWVTGFYPHSRTEVQLAEIAQTKKYSTQRLPDLGKIPIFLSFDPGCVEPR